MRDDENVILIIRRGEFRFVVSCYGGENVHGERVPLQPCAEQVSGAARHRWDPEVASALCSGPSENVWKYSLCVEVFSAVGSFHVI